MPIVVVGGHSRNVGKTSVVSGLISALPEYRWTAIKISQHEHDLGLHDNGSSSADPSFAISEELSQSGDSDTSGFLAAGAARAWWVRTQPGRLEEAMPAIRDRMADAEHVILESNSVLKFISPDLYIAVLDPAIEDFKPSAMEYLDRADAFVMHGNSECKYETSAWQHVSWESITTRPIFSIRRPHYVTSELVGFVRTRLIARRSHSS